MTSDENTYPGEIHRLTLPNSVAEMARLSDWIDSLDNALRPAARVGYALRLCLEEAVANIIAYAFEPGSTHVIVIEVWRQGKLVQATVTDDGRAFDPLKLPEPPKLADVSSAPIGGLGIKLMRQFASNITYTRTDRGNHLQFSFED
jgi:anti-sigma regulatory factor (Ser/Thr protein kinase)